jgi:hypothetical protein
MQKVGTLDLQLNPKNLKKNLKYDTGLTFYPGIIRILSLHKASKSLKYSLAALDENTIIGQQIVKEDSVNDKWRMIVWSNDNSNVFLYNMKFGKYLARKNNKLVLIDDDELPYINELGDKVNVKDNICCIWNGLNGNRHIYLTDDTKSEKLVKDYGKGYCVSGDSAKNLVIDNTKTCNIGDDCAQEGYTCKNILDRNFCDREGNFQPDSLAISIESTPGIGTPITGNIYLNIMENNSVTVTPIPDNIKSEMICTGTYVISGDKETPSICWTAIIQESPENTKISIPSRTGWSLSQMLSWDPNEDGILDYGRSNEPLANRFVNKKLQILENKKYPPYFTYSTSSPDATGCPTQYMSGTLLGPGRFAYMWNWQYVDQYSLFAGDQGSGSDKELYNIDAENMGIGMCNIKDNIPGFCPSGNNCENGVSSVGMILEGTSGAGKGGRFTFPTKYMIDAAHKNGCKIYGCGLFFQEIYYGGQYGWFMQALADPYLLAKKMIDVAVAYGFDGWMTNFETGVTDSGYTWGGTQEPNSAGYSGQIYAGKNYFTGEEISSDYWKNQIQGSSMPAFRMHGGDLCEGCTTCGSGPVGCSTEENIDNAPNSAQTCLNVTTEPTDGNKGVASYTDECSSVYVKGGGWADLQKNCNDIGNCKWVNSLKYNKNDGTPLYYTLDDGRICRQPYDSSFPMTCEDPSSKNQIGSLKFSGGDKGQKTKWAAENITSVENYKKQITNAISLRQNFRKFLQEFKKYKNKINADVSILMYDTEQLGGPLAGGITMPPAGRGCKPKGNATCYGNFNLWVDDDGTPLVDQIYDMNSGEFSDSTGALGVIPQGITSTYSLSNNNDIIEKFTNIKGNYYPDKSGWPSNTGPNAAGWKNSGDPGNINKQTGDCDGGRTGWAPFNSPGDVYCIPNNYEGSFMNNGIRPKNINLGLKRPYDYYQTIQLEGTNTVETPSKNSLGGNFKDAMKAAHDIFNNSATTPDWQKHIYCGIQFKSENNDGICDNDREAIEYPLSSVLKFDSGSDSIQKVSNILQNFSDKSIGIDYIDRVTSVAWTGGHLLGKEFRDNSESSNNFKGFGHIINERFVETKLPFSTYFSLGTGNNYYNKGVKIPFGPWTNWSLQDQLPTWQWRPELCDKIQAQNVRISYDISEAYQKSNCLLFRYTKNPSEWLTSTCNISNEDKEDCDCGGDDCGNKQQCLDNSGCCFDDSVDAGKYPWCYNKNDLKTDTDCNISNENKENCVCGGDNCGEEDQCLNNSDCCFDDNVDSDKYPWCYKKSKRMITSTYMFYAVKIPKNSYNLCLITKSNGEGFIELGVSEDGNEMNPEWVISSKNSKNNEWSRNKVKTKFKNNIACLWIRVTVSTNSADYLRLGGIEISKHVNNLIKVNPELDNFINEKGEKTTKMTWSNKKGIEYYEVYSNNNLLGLAYQGSNPRENTKMSYNVFNLNTEDIPYLIGVPSGVKTDKVKKPSSILLVILCFIGMIASIITFFVKKLYIKNKFRKNKKLIIILSVIFLISFITLFLYIATRRYNYNTREYKIEHWKDGKQHALGACFDDARVKCWRWLLQQWNKNNWNIKFTFYYNTLWLTRDLDWLKAVIKLGHEVGGHGHQHLTASDGSIPEKYLSDNIKYCAYLLKNIVYNNPNEQLTYAYPHGSLPILAGKRQSITATGDLPGDGNCTDSFCHTDFNCGNPDQLEPNTGRGYDTCKAECAAAGAIEGCNTCGGQGGCGGLSNAQDTKAIYMNQEFVKELQNNYINARTVTDMDFEDNTYIGVTNWPPNQTDVNTKNTISKDSTFFKNNGTMNTILNPIWSWPYQIDLNHSPDPDDNVTAKDITNNYIKQYESCLKNPNSMILLGGHDFNPTIEIIPGGTKPPRRDDIPCDNIQPPDVTPMELQNITCACCQNPTTKEQCPILKDEWGGMIPLYDETTGKFPDIDWSKRPSGDPKAEGGRPTGRCDLQWDEEKSKDCRQSCDSCWVATPGISIINFFNRIEKDKDKLWFGTFKEIVSYCYNRTNSELKLVSRTLSKHVYSLKTSHVYEGEISLSFKGAKNVKINNKSIEILKKIDGSEYINIQPRQGEIYIHVKY